MTTNHFEDLLRQHPKLAAYVKALETENDHLRQQVTTDELTGLYNFRFYEQLVETEMARAIRSNHPLALILDDIDHFKECNDTYGHQIGDEVLRRVARVKKSHVRETDYVCRRSGDEGATILPETSVAGAIKVAEMIRSSVSGLDIGAEVKRELDRYHGTRGLDDGARKRYHALRQMWEKLSNGTLAVTLSQGIGAYPNNDIINATGLVSKTDSALYLAKHRGRNRACTVYDLKNYEKGHD
jgi:diguanylate cyclase (GGDEF)-like protein